MPFDLRNAIAKRFLTVAAWALVVPIFAALWYAYDAGHSLTDPFVYYLGWSFYLWVVLTPVALWLAWHYPIGSSTWPRAIPLHLGVSIVLPTLQLSVEASLKWFRTGDEWPLTAVLRHYLRQHTQIGLMAYWLVVCAVQAYRMQDEARKRQIRAAQLEAQLAEARIENLRAQLHPHFLFNTLQAAATLIHEDPEGAEEVLQSLSQLLRYSLDGMQAHEVPLARELEFLEHYTGIQKRRFGDRLRFELQIDHNTLTCAVPSLALQPIVENAISHGIGKSKETDVVTIRAVQEEGRLCIEVTNLASTLDDELERLLLRGVGLSNTRGRLEQLYGRDQSLSLFNLRPRGVCAQLSIPARQLLSESMPTEGVRG